MSLKFSERIKNWNFLLQNKYKKNFHAKKNFSKETFPDIPLIFLEDEINTDKRILLGGLKYLPLIIFSFFKNFPMPWNFIRKVKVLFHQSRTLLIFSNKNPVIEKFFISQWSVEWASKDMRKKRNFKRVTFPILDDEESFGFYNRTYKTFFFETTFLQKNLQGGYIYKDWLRIEEDISLWFLRNSNKKSIFIDVPLRVSLLKLAFKGGLFLGTNFDFFFSKKQNLSKASCFFTHLKNKKDYFLFDLLYQKPSKIDLFKGKQNFFTFTNRSYVPFLPKINFFLKEKKFFRNLNSRKNFEKKENFFQLPKSFFLSRKNSELSIKNYIYIIPFFFDIFFDQKKISIVLKVFNKENFFSQNWEKFLPAFIVPILKKILMEPIDLSKPRISISYYFLLKKFFLKKNLLSKRIFLKKNNLLKIFKESKFFLNFETTWIEGGIKICKECHMMLLLLLGRKNLSFLNLDFNFNLKPSKTLTTKERKKSRFSNSFHLCREILRFTKMLIDCHVQMQIDFIDKFQLADGIHFILTHIGHLTGLYRYKYKVMKQIRICKSIKTILYRKLNNSEPVHEPGFTFWAPVWRVWVFFLRGMIPILERWLSNLLIRHFNGRRHSRKTVGFTKQRLETYFDIEVKAIFLNEIRNIFSKMSRISSLRQILTYANEAWKCWKANLNWNVPEIPKQISNIIFQFVKTKSDWWVKSTYLTREKIRRGLTIDKTLMRKNLGRLTRLWFKTEQKRQLDYLELGPWFHSEETTLTLDFFSKWLELSRFNHISFPSFSDKNDIKLLILALENVYQNTVLSNFKNQSRLRNLKTIENCFNDPEKSLEKIKEELICRKIFSDVGVSFLDNFSHLIPVFNFDFQEKLTDSFLDQYIWYKANTRSLFPNWVKPSDFEIAPFLVFKSISDIGRLFSGKKYSQNENLLGLKIKITDSLEKIDIPFLGRFLRKILDPTLANFLTLKNNVGIFHKDMMHLNIVGLIRGISFNGFVIQIYFLLLDIILLGLENSLFLCSFKPRENNFKETQKSFQFVKFYLRYLSNVTLVQDLRGENFFNIEPRILNSVKKGGECGFHSKKFLKARYEKKIPIFLGKLKIINEFYKENSLKMENQSIYLEICGFNILIFSFFDSKKPTRWDFYEQNNNQFKGEAVPRLAESTIQKFENRIRQIILSSGSTTFTKIINRWNSNILGTVSYFREACTETLKFLHLTVQCEKKIQNRIKISLNSKMPSRFPPVLFYSPKELGGLGMLSVSSQVISENDLKFSKKEYSNPKEFSSVDNNKVYCIPSLNDFLLTWKMEFLHSQKVWTEYLKRRIKKKTNKKIITIEDLEDLWNQGIPRINTLFQRDRNTLAFDHGWRLRLELKKYQQLKNNPFWWTSFKHDGKLWDLSEYRIQVIRSNGGIENILEHTLFKGTYFPSWEGLFWEKTSGFEESFNSKKLTNAQRSGLNQIPNRRFTLWWSPTINRGNVYIGFQVQLDLTGIFMHGKIPTLKISLIQIFRAHLWQKIHESICISFCKVLDNQFKSLYIQSIQKEQIHPRKSYKMNSSCADIVLFCKKEWKLNYPSPLSLSKEIELISFPEKTDKVWLDLQLRWGDFDSHDIERYSRGKFLDYTSDSISVYPSKKGALITFDLAYNIFGGYGYWVPGSKSLFRETALKIMKINPALYILRERIRKSLQLYVSEIPEPSLGFEGYVNIFEKKKVWLVDESCFYRVSVHRTFDGNLTAKPINGCLIIFLPDKGNLILRVIHVSFWKQQKRLSQLARWKVAEEISSIISSLPKEQHPVEILTSRKLLVDPLGIYLIDFPEISIKCTELRVFFQSLLKIPKLGNLVKKTPVSQSFIFNLYDDWFNSISPFTAFSRIVLILKAIEIDQEKAKKLIGISVSNESNFKKFWPKFSDEVWIKVENSLKDLILEDFKLKKNCDLVDFTQNEIRDIILGTYLNDSISNHKQEKKILTEELKINVISDTLKRTIFVSTSISKQTENFVSLSKWKTKFFSYQNSLDLSFRIKTRFISRKKNSFFYIVPRNILKQFISISSQNYNHMALVFAEKRSRSSFFREIRILLIPPQIASEKNIDFIKKIPDNKILNNFLFIGTIKTIRNLDNFPEENDLNYSREIWEENRILKIKEISLLGLRFLKKNWEFSGVRLEFFSNSFKFEKISKISLIISNRFAGFFVMPKNRKWNFFFKPTFFFKKKMYKVEISSPFFL